MKAMITILAVVLGVSYCLADIINIPDDFETIQAGIDSAEEADTVLVQPGVYVENIDFDGHNIVVGSLFITTEDTAYVDRTIIDGDSSDSVVQFGSRETEAAELSGFTLRNGFAILGGGIFIRDASPTLSHLVISGNWAGDDRAGYDGAGIYMDRNAAPNLRNVIIRNNRTQNLGHGGGIYCRENAIPELRNCTIINNWAKYGGALVADDAFPTLIESAILNNTGDDKAGGIWTLSHSIVTLEDVVISGNQTDDGGRGGAIFNDLGSTIIMNRVTVSSNIARYGGGIFNYRDGILDINDSEVIHNITINDGNGGGIYLDYRGVITLDHVLVANNRADSRGGGIYIDDQMTGPELNLTNLSLLRNSAGVEGGGLYLWNGSVTHIVNSILWDNDPDQIFISRTEPENFLSISFTDIEGGQEGIEDNHNVDLFWGDGNIDQDPVFVNPNEGNYFLAENSPCIDAGNPNSEVDPDRTISDMGKFFFLQLNPDPDIGVEPDSIGFPLTAVGDFVELTLTIRNYGGEILNVTSQTIIGEEDQFMIIEGGGELLIEAQTIHETVISYEPQEDGFFEAIYRIESNDPDQDIIEIPVTGSAEMRIPEIDVSVDSLYFGNLGFGVCGELTVYINSVGNSPLQVFNQYIEPDDQFFFIREGGGELSLEPATSHETVIAFQPEEYGSFEAVYVVESNDHTERRVEIPIVGCVLDVPLDESGNPTEFGIASVYPNPFNSTTSITFTVTKSSKVNLTIFDLDGREVETILDGISPAGIYSKLWSANSFAPGLYIVRLVAGGEVDGRKLVLVK
ncbi:MAG: choice-of-anchor D domain-containing protein [Calditrichaeota bacterium]|nr:choice-of-anchor D domain-containing protein [Calditrichota bacterium]